MRFVTLLENTARENFRCVHGLSLYIETPRHKLLFDSGPNGDFAANAEALGVDLQAVDLAILSHGHADHAGGLRTFLEKNDHAPVYLHKGAFGDFWSQKAGGGRHYIGMDPTLAQYEARFVVTEGVVRIDEELTLFDAVEDTFGALRASGNLEERMPDGTFRPESFAHEQDLLITAEGKSVLVAGCAHRGIVNIRRRAEELLGGEVSDVVAGFHLYELHEDGDELIDRTGAALQKGGTVYYTGHCTGEYACARLKRMLGGRLHRLCGGTEFTV